MPPTLQELVRFVQSRTEVTLGQLSEASGVARHLEEVSDALVTHFVSRCRVEGISWTDIGQHLGVTRQAAQQRFAVENVVTEQPQPSRKRREHFGKYRPLWSWLQNQRSDSVELKFADIERVLGFSLPPSSRKHYPHWHSYDGSAVVRAIVDAGWRAHRVDLKAETVIFTRS